MLEILKAMLNAIKFSKSYQIIVICLRPATFQMF